MKITRRRLLAGIAAIALGQGAYKALRPTAKPTATGTLTIEGWPEGIDPGAVVTGSDAKLTIKWPDGTRQEVKVVSWEMQRKPTINGTWAAKIDYVRCYETPDTRL